MAKKKPDDEQRPQPVAQWAPLGRLNVYPLYDHDLDRLAQGGSGSFMLNFSLFLLGNAVSLLVALLTTTIGSVRLYATFVSLCAVGFIAGITLFWVGLTTSVSANRLVQEIRARIPASEATQEVDETP